MSQSPDASERSRERDFLNRWPLARNIYDLIKTSPIEWSLRIGVYGKWGEGKTTVLNFIEDLATKDKLPIAWFNPWACQNQNDLTKVFSDSVELAFNKGSWSRGSVKDKAKKVVQGGQKIAKCHPVTKMLADVLNPLADNYLTTSRYDIEKTLREELGENKLIVLIDDVDRTRPELVPTLLLGLRENLDFRNCVFVLALDPDVVTSALGAVHEGWESSVEFLEKIINFPFWLTQPPELFIRRLINSEMTSSPLNIDMDALVDVLDLIPKNPRKLKLFMRGLWRYQPQLVRHEEKEIDWRLLILIELLRMHSIKTAQKILESKILLGKLVVSAYISPPKSTNESKEEEWVEAVNEIFSSMDGLTREQEKNITAVLHKLKEGLAGKDEQTVSYWARIHDNPDIFTWKEFRTVMSRFQTQPDSENLFALLKEHAQLREVSVRATLEEFIATLLTKREESLSFASNSVSEKDFKGHLALAKTEFSALRIVAIEQNSLTPDNCPLGPEQFIAILQHCSKWVHFKNHKLYRETRKTEEKFLEILAKKSNAIAIPILEIIKPYDSILDPFPEKNTLVEKVTDNLLPEVYKDLQDRFLRNDGIHNLWGAEGHKVQKWVLFRRESGFYTKQVIEFLGQAKNRAKKSLDIQHNFVQFIMMLGHGLEKGLVVLAPDDLKGLAKDAELMKIVWQGAMATNLQPRIKGTIEKCREVLLSHVGEDCLPLPQTWSERQS